MVTRKQSPVVTIPDESVARFLFGGGLFDPGKPALIDGSTHQAITYGALRDDIRQAAAGLLAALTRTNSHSAEVASAEALEGGPVSTSHCSYFAYAEIVQIGPAARPSCD